MHRFRNASKFRIGDGLAEFEFSLRQTTLEHNTNKINVINLSKSIESKSPKSENKNKVKNSFNYDPRRTDINAMIDSLNCGDEEESDISTEDNNNTLLNHEIDSKFKIHPPNSPYHYSPLAARSNKNAKSKSHNFSKYDRLNFKSNIRKKKNITDNFNQALSLSSFRAPEQLRQLMLSFSQLEYIVRDFLRNNQYYTQFAERWKYFSDSFDRFIETASLHFSSNFNYNSDSQCSYRQITKTTPVYLTSEIIVNNFSEFIHQSKEVQSHSSKLIYSIQKEFEKIHKLIQKTRNSMTQNRYRTDVPCIKLEEFQNNVISLNEELFPKNFLNDNSKIELNLNKKRLHKQICELNREVFEIFHKFLKYSFINLAIKIQIRTDLSSCISNIEESLLVAERIRYFVENLRNFIYKTNKELTTVLNLMGFPYHIDLDEMNQNDESKGVVYKKEAAKGKIDLSAEKEIVKRTNTEVNEIESIDNANDLAVINDNENSNSKNNEEGIDDEQINKENFSVINNEEESINNENSQEINSSIDLLQNEEESINNESPVNNNNDVMLNEEESVNNENNQEINNEIPVHNSIDLLQNEEESIGNENSTHNNNNDVMLNEEESIGNENSTHNNNNNDMLNEKESVNNENSQEINSSIDLLQNEEESIGNENSTHNNNNVMLNEEESINNESNHETDIEESNKSAVFQTANVEDSSNIDYLNEEDSNSLNNNSHNKNDLHETRINRANVDDEESCVEESANKEADDLAFKPLNNYDDLLNYFDDLSNEKNALNNDDDILSDFDEIEKQDGNDDEMLSEKYSKDSNNSEDERE